MNLFLFTNFFPFKRSEPFLVNEFEFTKKAFDHITLFALYGNVKESMVAPDKHVTILTPPLASASDKKTLFVNGLLNTAAFDVHLRELFSKGLFLSPKKLYGFFTSLFVTRLILSSPAYKQLLKAINTSEKPVLYFYWGDNFCWIIPYLRRHLKNKEVKIVVRFHGSDLYEYLKNDYSPLREEVVKGADLLVPVSEFGKQYMQTKYAPFKNKVQLSRLGVFDNGLNPAAVAGSRQIVSVSNVVPVKRIHLIFEALQQMQTPITWHHFGDGPLLDGLKKTAEQKRTGLDIIFHGHVSNKQLMEFYRTQPVDLLLNVSASEGLPVSIMEAYSFGVPAIATNVGGTSDLVSQESGYLIASDFNPTELAQKIEQLLHLDAAETAALRIRSRAIFEEKVWAEKNYIAFYKMLGGFFSS